MNASTGEDARAQGEGSKPPPLFTIGYGTRTVEELIAALQSRDIQFLIDVRTAPYSKFKPEFSKDSLAQRVESAGIRYLFMGDTLGGQPSDPSCHTEGKIDYDKVRTQPFFQRGLERLRSAFEQRRRVALMCSEGRPEQCHRSKLIGEALAAEGIPLCHIDENGALVSQTEVICRLTHGQLDLFGQPAFTSRKRYAPRRVDGEGSED